MAYSLTSLLGGTDLIPLKDPAYADAYGDPIYNYIFETQSETVTKTVDLNFADKVLSRAKLKDTSETVYSAGNITGAVALDYTNGQWQYATATGNITSLTISNWPATGSGGWMVLDITQDATGSRTIDLTGGTYYAVGANITLSTAASSRDRLLLSTRDGGTTVRVDLLANYEVIV